MTIFDQSATSRRVLTASLAATAVVPLAPGEADACGGGAISDPVPSSTVGTNQSASVIVAGAIAVAAILAIVGIVKSVTGGNSIANTPQAPGPR